MKVAIVHDWLDTWRGGENVLAAIVRLYPEADLFSLVDFLTDEHRRLLGGKRARTTFLQRLPGARRHFRALLPLFPRAIESLDVSGYDLVISSSHAVAKSVPTHRGQWHVCYCHTPMRYAWDLRDQYLARSPLGRGWRGLLVRKMLDRLRDWDRRTSDRVDVFVANSRYIRDRIARCYGREASVIHPPVDVEFYTPDPLGPAPHERQFFLAASRWVPYKRLDVIVDAFRRMPDLELVVVGDGPDAARFDAKRCANIRWEGEVPRERLRALLRGARALVFAADEDFGILPVEAQACGTPVIAYGKGGVTETVCAHEGSDRTGIFFPEQSDEALAAAVRAFQSSAMTFQTASCRRSAERFSGERFAREFRALIEALPRSRVRSTA